MKIIFLDLDGVLNIEEGPRATFRTTMKYFDSELIERFNLFLDEYPEIHLVMSSSWREDMDDAIKQLSLCGFRHSLRFIGKTGFNKGLMLRRGQEIQNWIDENEFSGKYICIDDFTCEIVDFINPEFCLKTESDTGITNDDIITLKLFFGESL
jgi:hypothetical protein